MHIDSIIIKNTERTLKCGYMKRYRWIYMALPFTVAAVLIGMITNAWSPYAPIIILFCCLLVTCELKVCTTKKPENPSVFLTLPVAHELSVLCMI